MSLRVSPVNFGVSNVVVNGKKQVENISRPLSVNYTIKPDNFKKSEFVLQDAINSLSTITEKRNGQIYQKFDKNDLNILSVTLSKNPEKWDSVNALARKEHLSAYNVTNLARNQVDKLNLIRNYSDVNNTKSKPRYSGEDLIFLSNRLNVVELNKAMPLTNTSIGVKNIVNIAKNKDVKFIKSAADRILEVEHDVSKDDVKQIIFVRDKSDKKAYNVIAQTNNGDLNSVLLDSNLKKDAIENAHVYKAKNGNIYQVKKVNDFRNNTVSKVRLQVDASGYPFVTNEVRVIKDKNNNVLKTEYTSPSEVPGVFDIKVQYPNGKQEILSSGHVDKKHGITSIKKNLVSLDGTKTEYLYENDVDGNRISDYKITDKNGNVLLKKSSTFEVINENKIITSNNKDKYEIILDDKSLKVTDMKNPKRFEMLSIDSDIQGNKRAILQSLKQMPGEELIKLAQSTKTLVGIDSPLESYYQPSDKSIHSGEQLFVVLHELGHARDMRDLDVSNDMAYYQTLNKTVSSDKKLNKIYEEEVSAFNKAFPDAQRNHIDYFINTLNHYGGEKGGLQETIAESNALLTTPKTMDLLAIRSQYLQQYFPRTIAHLSEVLSKEIV